MHRCPHSPAPGCYCGWLMISIAGAQVRAPISAPNNSARFIANATDTEQEQITGHQTDNQSGDQHLTADESRPGRF